MTSYLVYLLDSQPISSQTLIISTLPQPGNTNRWEDSVQLTSLLVTQLCLLFGQVACQCFSSPPGDIILALLACPPNDIIFSLQIG
jgi:hypothetical protein